MFIKKHRDSLMVQITEIKITAESEAICQVLKYKYAMERLGAGHVLLSIIARYFDKSIYAAASINNIRLIRATMTDEGLYRFETEDNPFTYFDKSNENLSEINKAIYTVMSQ